MMVLGYAGCDQPLRTAEGLQKIVGKISDRVPEIRRSSKAVKAVGTMLQADGNVEILPTRK